MYSQKNYKQKLGTSNQSISAVGCYLVSFCNFLETRGIKKNPLELNEFLIKNGGFSNGNLFNSAKVAQLFGMTYKKILKNPGIICIAETDYWKKIGVPQHFFLYLNNLMIDPLDSAPDWRTNALHKIISYRVFSEIKPVEASENQTTTPTTIKPVETIVDAPSTLKNDSTLNPMPSNTTYTANPVSEPVQVRQAENPMPTVELATLEIIKELLKRIWRRLKNILTF